MREAAGGSVAQEPEGIDFESVVGVDPLELTGAQRCEWLVRAHRIEAQLNAATVAVTGAFDTNLDWAADGAKSAQAWIAARTPIAPARAHSDVHTARRLRHCPKVAAAARQGRLSRDLVAALLKARQPGLEEAFELCEELLVDEVADCTVAAAHTFLRHWVLEVRTRLGINEPDGSKPGGSDASQVHLVSTFKGRWDLQGDLDPETGEIMANALDHQIDAMWRDGVFHTDDGLSQPQRRAIALTELVCRAARGGDEDGTARPLILGITTLDPHAALDSECADAVNDDDATAVTSQTEPPAPPTGHTSEWRPFDPRSDSEPDNSLANLSTQLRISELSRSGPLPEARLQRWVCEGDVIPYAVNHDGDILRMGRRIRLANRAQRRALIARDGCCQFGGCATPAEYCVPHHLHYWELGGPTDIENLVLLCRFHHDAVHRRGFTVTRTRDGTVTVRRPGRGTTVTPHLRIRASVLPRRRPSADEVAQRRFVRERLRAFREGREDAWLESQGRRFRRRCDAGLAASHESGGAASGSRSLLGQAGA